LATKLKKIDTFDHRVVKNGQIGYLGGFKYGFSLFIFSKNNKKNLIYSLKIMTYLF
jgi:hypothetical protein